MFRFSDDKDREHRPDELLDEEDPGELAVAPGKQNRTDKLDIFAQRSQHRTRTGAGSGRTAGNDKTSHDAGKSVSDRRAPTPGKIARTQRLESQPWRRYWLMPAQSSSSRASGRVATATATVQRKAAPGARVHDDEAGRIKRAALRGVADGGQPLPYLDIIQRSFGTIDISFIRAHFGEEAARACEAMEAEAYATGAHVAFRDRPDLFTVVHEAVHILQQASGVSVPGGVGQKNDAYERQADAVAERVVRGESVEAELAAIVTPAATGTARPRPRRAAQANHAGAAQANHAGAAQANHAGAAQANHAGAAGNAVQRFQISRAFHDVSAMVEGGLDGLNGLAQQLSSELMSRLQQSLGAFAGLPDAVRSAVESGDLSGLGQKLMQLAPDELDKLTQVFGTVQGIERGLARIAELPGQLRSALLSGDAAGMEAAQAELGAEQQKGVARVIDSALGGGQSAPGGGAPGANTASAAQPISQAQSHDTAAVNATMNEVSRLLDEAQQAVAGVNLGGTIDQAMRSLQGIEHLPSLVDRAVSRLAETVQAQQHNHAQTGGAQPEVATPGESQTEGRGAGGQPRPAPGGRGGAQGLDALGSLAATPKSIVEQAQSIAEAPQALLNQSEDLLRKPQELLGQILSLPSQLGNTLGAATDIDVESMLGDAASQIQGVLDRTMAPLQGVIDEIQRLGGGIEGPAELARITDTVARFSPESFAADATDRLVGELDTLRTELENIPGRPEELGRLIDRLRDSGQAAGNDARPAAGQAAAQQGEQRAAQQGDRAGNLAAGVAGEHAEAGNLAAGVAGEHAGAGNLAAGVAGEHAGAGNLAAGVAGEHAEAGNLAAGNEPAQDAEAAHIQATAQTSQASTEAQAQVAGVHADGVDEAGVAAEQAGQQVEAASQDSAAAREARQQEEAQAARAAADEATAAPSEPAAETAAPAAAGDSATAPATARADASAAAEQVVPAAASAAAGPAAGRAAPAGVAAGPAAVAAASARRPAASRPAGAGGARTASLPQMPAAPAQRPELAPVMQQPSFEIQAEGQTSQPVPEVPVQDLPLEASTTNIQDDPAVVERRQAAQQAASAIDSAAGAAAQDSGGQGQAAHAGARGQAASAQSAAQAPGQQSAAQAPGQQSAAQAPGQQSAAQAPGQQSAAQAPGQQSAAQAPGQQGQNSNSAGQNSNSAGQNPNLSGQNPNLSGQNPNLSGQNPNLSGQNPNPASASAQPADPARPDTAEPPALQSIHGHAAAASEASTAARDSVARPAPSFDSVQAAQGATAPAITTADLGPAPSIPEIPAPAPDQATTAADDQVGMAAVRAVPDTVDISGDVARANQALATEKATEARVPPAADAQQAAHIAPLAEHAASTYASTAAQAVPVAENARAHAAQVSAQSTAHEQSQMAAKLAERDAQVAATAHIEPPLWPQLAPDQIQARAQAAALPADAFAPVTPSTDMPPATQALVDAVGQLGAGREVPADPGNLATNRAIPELDTSGAAAAKEQIAQNAAQTLDATTQLAPPAVSLPVPGGRAPAGASAGGGGGAMPSREQAIASIEAAVAAQVEAQAPAQMQQAAQAARADMAPAIDQARAQADQHVAQAQAQAQAQVAQARSQPPPDVAGQVAAVQARENAQVQATSSAAQAQAQATASAAQAQASAQSSAAASARNAAVSAAQAAQQAQVAQAQAQFSAEQAQAQAQAQASQAQAQAAKAAQDAQAQAQAQAQTAAEQARGEAEKAQAESQRQAEQTQAQAQHDAEVAAEEARGQAEQTQAEAQADAEVAQHEAQMQSETAALEAEGQANFQTQMAAGQAAYEQEVARGKAEADAERARAEAEAAAARAQAESEKSRGQSLLAKGLAWAGGMVQSLLSKAKAILQAAQAAITNIMNRAREAAKAALDSFRDLAKAALDAARDAIQGVIKAAADAIRQTIERAAQLIRQIIQAVAQAIQALVQVLSQALIAIVEAFQTALNAIIEAVIAAVALINADLAQALQQAVAKYQDAINQALDKLQSDIQTASDSMQQSVQQAADQACNQISQAENQLVSQVNQIEAQLHQTVDQAVNAAKATVDAAVDAAKAAVDAAVNAAQAAVDAYFEAQIAVVDAAHRAVATATEAAVAAVDWVLEKASEAAAALVDMLPDAVVEGFIDFWNSPWREAIIIGLVTIGAVAFSVATLGTGAPLAAALLAGVVGGTVGGLTYFGGELVARQGEIDLYEDGKGLYIPGHGYAQVDPTTGQLVPPPGMNDAAALEWAASNFHPGPNGELIPRSHLEIGNAAEAEGWEGARKAAISSAAAALGGAAAGKLGTALQQTGRFGKVSQVFITGVTEGAFDLAGGGIDAGIDTYNAAIAAGKSPQEALAAARQTFVETATSPQAIASTVLASSAGAGKTRLLPDADDATRLADRVLYTAGDQAFDITSDVTIEASTTYGDTYLTAVLSGKSHEEAHQQASQAAEQQLSAGAILTTTVNTVGGAGVSNVSERAGNRVRDAFTGGSSNSTPGTTPGAAPDAASTAPDTTSTAPASTAPASTSTAPASTAPDTTSTAPASTAPAPRVGAAPRNDASRPRSDASQPRSDASQPPGPDNQRIVPTSQDSGLVDIGSQSFVVPNQGQAPDIGPSRGGEVAPVRVRSPINAGPNDVAAITPGIRVGEHNGPAYLDAGWRYGVSNQSSSQIDPVTGARIDENTTRWNHGFAPQVEARTGPVDFNLQIAGTPNALSNRAIVNPDGSRRREIDYTGEGNFWNTDGRVGDARFQAGVDTTNSTSAGVNRDANNNITGADFTREIGNTYSAGVGYGDNHHARGAYFDGAHARFGYDQATGLDVSVGSERSVRDVDVRMGDYGLSADSARINMLRVSDLAAIADFHGAVSAVNGPLNLFDPGLPIPELNARGNLQSGAVTGTWADFDNLRVRTPQGQGAPISGAMTSGLTWNRGQDQTTANVDMWNLRGDQATGQPGTGASFEAGTRYGFSNQRSEQIDPLTGARIASNSTSLDLGPSHRLNYQNGDRQNIDFEFATGRSQLDRRAIEDQDGSRRNEIAYTGEGTTWNAQGQLGDLSARAGVDTTNSTSAGISRDANNRITGADINREIGNTYSAELGYGNDYYARGDYFDGARVRAGYDQEAGVDMELRSQRGVQNFEARAGDRGVSFERISVNAIRVSDLVNLIDVHGALTSFTGPLNLFDPSIPIPGVNVRGNSRQGQFSLTLGEITNLRFRSPQGLSEPRSVNLGADVTWDRDRGLMEVKVFGLTVLRFDRAARAIDRDVADNLANRDSHLLSEPNTPRVEQVIPMPEHLQSGVPFEIADYSVDLPPQQGDAARQDRLSGQVASQDRSQAPADLDRGLAARENFDVLPSAAERGELSPNSEWNVKHPHTVEAVIGAVTQGQFQPGDRLPLRRRLTAGDMVAIANTTGREVSMAFQPSPDGGPGTYYLVAGGESHFYQYPDMLQISHVHPAVDANYRDSDERIGYAHPSASDVDILETRSALVFGGDYTATRYHRDRKTSDHAASGGPQVGAAPSRPGGVQPDAADPLRPNQGSSAAPDVDADVRTAAHEEARTLMTGEMERVVAEMAQNRKQRPIEAIQRLADTTLPELRARLEARNLPADWLTRDAVIDIIGTDPKIQRALHRAAAQNDGIKTTSDVIEAADPALRLADRVRDAKTDRERLDAIRETLLRLGTGQGLLTSTQGDTLFRTLQDFQSTEARRLATQMLATGRVLDINTANRSGGRLSQSVGETTQSLDGSKRHAETDIATELYALTNAVDAGEASALDPGERMGRVKDRIERLRDDLAAAQAELGANAPGTPEHDAATQRVAALMNDARALERTFGSSAHLLDTLAGQDQQWFRDSLAPVLGAARGQNVPPRPGQGPATGNTTELFWRSNDLYADMVKGKQGSQARDILDRVVKAASTAEQNGRGNARELLSDFARRYSEKHGSFRELLQAAAASDTRAFQLKRRDQETGELARLQQLFGIQDSMAVRRANDQLAAPLDRAQEAELARLAGNAAQTLNERASMGQGLEMMTRGNTPDRVARVLDDFKAELTRVVPELSTDPDRAARMARDLLRAEFESRYGSLDAHLAEIRTAARQYARNPDRLLAFSDDPSYDARLAALDSERNAVAKGEDELTEYQQRRGLGAGDRLAADKRAQLFEQAGGLKRDLEGAFKFVLEADADTRRLLLDDPVLLQRLADTFPGVYPFLYRALTGDVSPHQLLPVIITIKQLSGLGVDPVQLLTKGQGKLLSGDVVGFITDSVRTVAGKLQGKAGELMRQRMHAKTQEALSTYLKYEEQRIKSERGLGDSDDDKRALGDLMHQRGVELMGDPEFRAMLDQHFSAEQKESLFSMLLNKGSVSPQDRIRQERINPLEQSQNIYKVIEDAAKEKDGAMLDRLRRDPATWEQLQKLGTGQRIYAMHLLQDTPASRVLRELAGAWNRLPADKSWAMVDALADLDREKIAALRSDPALVEYLASQMGEGQAPYFRQLMGLEANNVARQDNENLADNLEIKRFEETRILNGLLAAMARGDNNRLLSFAGKAYQLSVADPRRGDASPDFDQKVQRGHLAGDMLTAGHVRERIVDKLRIAPEFQKLQKERPDLAAAVVDAVLGKTDPALMQYQREMSRSVLTSPSGDNLVSIIKDATPEFLLRDFVNSDEFAPVLADYLTARRALEQAEALPDSDANKADAVDQARTTLEQTRTAMAEFPFDISARRAEGIDARLSSADRAKVRDSIRERVIAILGSKVGDNDAMVARALDGAMADAVLAAQADQGRAQDQLDRARAALAEAQRTGKGVQEAQDRVDQAQASLDQARQAVDRLRPVADDNLRVTQADTQVIGGGERETRTRVIQAERRLDEDRADIERLVAWQKKADIPLPRSLDMSEALKKYQDAVTAWRTDLDQAKSSPTGLDDDAQKRLAGHKAKVDAARKQLLDTRKRVIDHVVNFIGGKVEKIAGGIEGLTNVAVTIFGPAAAVPVAILTHDLKVALTTGVKASLRRVLEANGGVIRADDVRAIIRDVIKQRLNEGMGQAQEGSWLLEQVTKRIDDFLANDLPFLPNDLGIEERIDKKIDEVAGKQLKRIDKFDEQLFAAGEGAINQELGRGTPQNAGASRYAESMQREARAQAAIASLQSGVAQKAQQLGLRGKAADQASELTSALLAALSSGDTTRLRAALDRTTRPDSALRADQARALLWGLGLEQYKDVVPLVMPERRIARIQRVIGDFAVGTSQGGPLPPGSSAALPPQSGNAPTSQPGQNAGQPAHQPGQNAGQPLGNPQVAARIHELTVAFEQTVQAISGPYAAGYAPQAGGPTLYQHVLAALTPEVNAGSPVAIDLMNALLDLDQAYRESLQRVINNHGGPQP